MTDWLKTNGATAIGWVAVLIVVGWNGGARLALLEGSQADTQSDVAETSRKVEHNAKRITDIKGDVRSLAERGARQEQVITRQEESLRELDRLVVELKVIMKKGN